MYKVSISWLIDRRRNYHWEGTLLASSAWFFFFLSKTLNPFISFILALLKSWGRGTQAAGCISKHTQVFQKTSGVHSWGDSVSLQANLLSISFIPNTLLFFFSVFKLNNSIFRSTKMRVKSLWFIISVLSFTDSTIAEIFDYPFCFQVRLKVLWILTALQQQ